jgi:DNA (cytosine-5)-methyltransferase 1
MEKERAAKHKKVTAVDLFCGAGGMSSGLLEAFHLLKTRCELTAINHWPTAVETHSLNHPQVKHICEDISNVNPRKLFCEGEVQVLVGGPACTTHSSARGGRPLDCDQDRATPWCLVRWAESTLPEIIIIENVEQFRLWGALIKKRCAIKKPKPPYSKWSAEQRKLGRPCSKKEWESLQPTTEYKTQWVPDKTRQGETFQAWIKCFEALGYKVDHKVLCTADYGDPTTRRRLFVMATRGKRKPIWPNPTHQENPPETTQTLRPWVPTHDIVDWSLQGKSIFNRKTPLVDKTMRRVWIGFKKFALPKIIEAQRNRQTSAETPTPIVTPKQTGIPGCPNNTSFLIKYKGTATAEPIQKPITTIQASGKHHGLAQVTIEEELQRGRGGKYHGQSGRKVFVTELGFGEKNPQGETHRSKSITKTLGTITGSNNWYLTEGEVNEVFPLKETPFLVQIAHGNDKPTDDNRRARSTENTMPTVTGAKEWAIGEPKIHQKTGYLLHTNHQDCPNGNNNRVKGLNTTFPTVCGNRGEVALATSEIKIPAYTSPTTRVSKKKNANHQVQSLEAPAPDLSPEEDHLLIEGTACPCENPNPNQNPQKEITCYKSHPSKKTGHLIEFDPDISGLPRDGKFFIQILSCLYEVDIKLRMFEPHELSLAQGFPKTYKFVGNKTQQIKQIGNAVPRRTVRALILAAWTQNANIPFIPDPFDKARKAQGKNHHES